MTEREQETYQVAYYHQDEPGSKEVTAKMDLSSAKAQAEVLQAEVIE